ncbi:hypothetical protein [Pseudonocardia xishanensis]|uniref:Uncharacterized protein n=1 Tax=Pseudonocardia xishanensis TaxID=630995 RepID=A0ABP8RED5_9PSEU
MLALVLWAPFLVWQGLHGWPRVALSRRRRGGALRRFAPEVPVVSGHSAFADWSTPADPGGRTVVVGYPEPERWFTGCAPAATIDDGVGLDNQERGRTVWACGPPRQPWSELWPQLRRVGEVKREGVAVLSSA